MGGRLQRTSPRRRGVDGYIQVLHAECFWMNFSEMMRADFTAELACDKTYSVYGSRLPITRTISAMICDKKDGAHLELWVVND